MPGGLALTNIADGIEHVRTRISSWVILHDAERVVLIDCGYPGQMRQVRASLRAVGVDHLPVEAVLITHAHADHAGTAAQLQASGSRILGSPPVVRSLARMKLEQVTLSDVLTRLWRPRYLLWAGSAVAAGGLRWEPVAAEEYSEEYLQSLPGKPRPIETEGHAEGHSMFLLDGGTALATGDALATGHPVAGTFSAPPPLPAVFNRKDEMARHEAAAIRLPDGITVLPGHGRPWRHLCNDVT